MKSILNIGCILVLACTRAHAFNVRSRGFFRDIVRTRSLSEKQVVVEKVLTPFEEHALEVRTTAESSDAVVALTASEINARLKIQLEKLRLKDQTSRKLSREEVSIVYEDAHVVICDKPTGVLSVPGKVKENNSFNQAVFEAVDDCEMERMDMMVVHRLGMDSSGLMAFAKTRDGMLGMNTVFRTRKIERKYEALVCGHVKRDSGFINLPLMRDYEYPPFMRISTDDHQRALIDLDPEDVGKKLLELPKESLTKYEVISREEFAGQPVTRVTLTSISGRTHQLNVHLAAFGHPIVGDRTYGINGDAAPNGGLSETELKTLVRNKQRASLYVQRKIADAATFACIHAKSLKFRHPITKKVVDIATDAPF